MAETGAHIIVRGRVQGVGFRDFVAGEARARSLTGTVRNLPDGGVEVDVEGSRNGIEDLIRRLQIGPPGSRVTDVATTWRSAAGKETRFSVAW